MELSIICTTYQRSDLLRRSFYTWLRSSFIGNPDGHTEILIACDDYTEVGEVIKLLRVPSYDFRHYSVTAFPVKGRISGSHVAGYNKAASLARGDILLFTHPEIMFDANTIKSALTETSQTFTTFKPYWIPREMQTQIESLPWMWPERLEKQPGLYMRSSLPESPQEWDKGWNMDMKARTDWESTTTFAMERNTFNKMGAWPEFDTWGPDDPWHQGRRWQVGIKTKVVMDSMVYHQWHGRSQETSREEIDRAAKTALQR